MKSHYQDPSHLFTLRLWKEPLRDGVVELRFQVHHVLTGESRLFRDEEQLVTYLRNKLEGSEQENP